MEEENIGNVQKDEENQEVLKLKSKLYEIQEKFKPFEELESLVKSIYQMCNGKPIPICINAIDLVRTNLLVELNQSISRTEIENFQKAKLELAAKSKGGGDSVTDDLK